MKERFFSFNGSLIKHNLLKQPSTLPKKNFQFEQHRHQQQQQQRQSSNTNNNLYFFLNSSRIQSRKLGRNEKTSRIR
jgi:hypothetical protein